MSWSNLEPNTKFIEGGSCPSAQLVYPPWNQHSAWKVGVGRLLSFWEGLFSGAMLVLGRVISFQQWLEECLWTCTTFNELSTSWFYKIHWLCRKPTWESMNWEGGQSHPLAQGRDILFFDMFGGFGTEKRGGTTPSSAIDNPMLLVSNAKVVGCFRFFHWCTTSNFWKQHRHLHKMMTCWPGF